MQIVVIMKSKESFKRIRLQVDNNSIEWEPIFDLDDLREKIVFIKYDIAIVDTNIWWKDEAIELFNKFKIDTIMFEGDFEEISQEIRNKIPINTPAEEVENLPEELTNEERPIRYIEKEIIREKEVKVKVPVYKEVYTGIPKQLIIIANLSKRAGSTFVTLNLAKALSDLKILCSVIENPVEPYIFDTIGLEQRLIKNRGEDFEFYSYPHLIYENKKIEKDMETIEDGIIWLVSDPRKPLIQEQHWDYYKMMKLLYASRKASISILDIGYNIDKDYIKPILDEADKIFIVIDPMPTEIMQNKKLFDDLLELKKDGLPIEFIINRWTSGIDKKQLLNHLKITPLALIPAIDLKLIHKAIYDCKIPYSVSEIKEELSIPFNNIVKRIIPSEFITEEKAKTGYFKNKFFKKNKRKEQ